MQMVLLHSELMAAKKAHALMAAEKAHAHVASASEAGTEMDVHMFCCCLDPVWIQSISPCPTVCSVPVTAFTHQSRGFSSALLGSGKTKNESQISLVQLLCCVHPLRLCLQA